MTTIPRTDMTSELPAILDRVARGETILITESGKPFARLVPEGTPAPKDPAAVGRAMLEYRDKFGPTLGDDLTIRQLIEEGRR